MDKKKSDDSVRVLPALEGRNALVHKYIPLIEVR
jgi:hypothetical protein